jgi:hypothetical protein
MTISDETLMAYADGELDPVVRAAVESAMREDPQIEGRVAAHRSLRQRVQAAYSSELLEDVPEALLAAVRTGADRPQGRVVNLQVARAASERAATERAASGARPARWRWETAAAMAASIVVGVGLGFFMWGQSESPLVRSIGGELIARGQLAKALSSQLAAQQSRDSQVRIGISFLAKSGDYCRTFALSGAVSPAGLACRRGAEWQIQTLTKDGGGAAESEYRTAGSDLSGILLKSVEGSIVGEPLDQAGEKAALDRDWKTAPPTER